MKKGFTLAEVLITLAIIGVVAALSISTVVSNYQKTETISKLKKFFNTMSQAYYLAVAEHGSPFIWNVGNVGSAEDTKEFLNQYVIPYLKVSKSPTTYNEGHWDRTRYFLNGTRSDYKDSSVRFILNDGSSITAVLNNQPTDSSTAREFLFYYDTNGDKGPNKNGRDVFVFLYFLKNDNSFNSGFKPYDVMGGASREYLLSTQDDYNCNKNKTGSRCSAVIMKDGWQIKDDYPW